MLAAEDNMAQKSVWGGAESEMWGKSLHMQNKIVLKTDVIICYKGTLMELNN